MCHKINPGEYNMQEVLVFEAQRQTSKRIAEKMLKKEKKVVDKWNNN